MGGQPLHDMEVVDERTPGGVLAEECVRNAHDRPAAPGENCARLRVRGRETLGPQRPQEPGDVIVQEGVGEGTPVVPLPAVRMQPGDGIRVVRPGRPEPQLSRSGHGRSSSWFPAAGQLPAVTALSSSSDSLMSCGNSARPVPVTQRSKPILKTAIPASAVRLAAGSLTPRPRNAPASAAASDASLISSRSWRLGVGGDHGLALPGVFAALLEQGAGGLQCRGDRLDRRHRFRRAGDGAHQETPAA